MTNVDPVPLNFSGTQQSGNTKVISERSSPQSGSYLSCCILSRNFQKAY